MGREKTQRMRDIMRYRLRLKRNEAAWKVLSARNEVEKKDVWKFIKSKEEELKGVYIRPRKK